MKKNYLVVNTNTKARRWFEYKFHAEQLQGKWMNKTGNYCAVMSYSDAVKYGWVK